MQQSVFQYPGGKVRLSKKIVSLFPLGGTYDTFVDVFGGAGNVILILPDRPGLLKVYNDVDAQLVNFFKVLRDPATRERLIEMLNWTTYSRQQFKECLEMPEPGDPVTRAWRFFTVIEQSFSGKTLATATPGRWAYGTNGKTNKLGTWVNSIKNLQFFGERFQHIQIENLNYADVIARYDSPTCLIYADPPYIATTRAKDQLYTKEMFTVEQHKKLAEIFNNVRGMVVLSGYDCPEYREWYGHWEKHEFDVVCLMSGQGSVAGQKDIPKARRTECVWLNPACVKAGGRVTQLNFFDQVS